jgi:hypothetical protein
MDDQYDADDATKTKTRDAYDDQHNHERPAGATRMQTGFDGRLAGMATDEGCEGMTCRHHPLYRCAFMFHTSLPSPLTTRISSPCPSHGHLTVMTWQWCTMVERMTTAHLTSAAGTRP